MKTSIFDEQTAKAIKKWHQGARKRHGRSSSLVSILPSQLRRLKTVGGRLTSPVASSSKQKEQQLLDFSISEIEEKDVPAGHVSTEDDSTKSGAD